jgi:hypothetical protein
METVSLALSFISFDILNTAIAAAPFEKLLPWYVGLLEKVLTFIPIARVCPSDVELHP